jgi:hypothetical protein
MMGISRSAAFAGTGLSVSYASPNFGYEAGSTSITIYGSGFSGSTVTIGGAAATSVVVVSPTQITCVTPAGTIGAANIVVTNSDLTTSGTSGNSAFTYIFDRQALSLTAYFKNYAGVVWNGSTSAGVSSSQTLSGSNNPTVGSQNGHGTAVINGTTNLLAFNNTLETYINTNSSSGYAVVNLTSIDSNNATTPLNDALLAASSVYYGLFFKNDGVNKTVVFYIFDAGTNRTCSRAIATGAWTVITWKHSGSTMYIGVDELPGAAGGASTGATSATNSPSNRAQTPRIGAGSGGAGPINGILAEFGWSDTVISDANFTKILNSMRAEYGY